MRLLYVLLVVFALTFSASAKGYGPGSLGSVAGVGGIPGRAGGYYAMPGGGAIPGSFAGGVPTYVGVSGGNFQGAPGSYVGGAPGAPASGLWGNSRAPGSYSGNPGISSGSPLTNPGSYPGLPGGYRTPGSQAGLPGSYPGSPGSSSEVSGGYYPADGVGSSIYGYDLSPKPYNFAYEAPDDQGGAQFRSESADGSGAVSGTYGYFDAQGLYRVVEYVADEQGFRARVQTNEPGVDGKENPADVEMIVEQTPPGIQEMYTPLPAAYGGGDGSLGVGGAGQPGYAPGAVGGARQPGSAYAPGVIGGARQPGSAYAPGVIGGARQPGSAYAPGAVGGARQPGSAYAPGVVGGARQPGSAYAPGVVGGARQPGSAYAPGVVGGARQPGSAYAPGAVGGARQPGSAYAPGAVGGAMQPGSAYAPGAVGGAGQLGSTYATLMGNIRQGAYSGTAPGLGAAGAGPFGGGSGLFSGIPKSASGKSGY